MRSTLLLTALAGYALLSSARVAVAQEVPPAGERDALTSALHDLRDALRWESADGDAWAELGGRFAWDLTRRGHANAKGDGGSVSAARVVLRGGQGPLDVRIEGDAKGTDTRGHLGEAWARWTIAPELRVRAGQIRQALGSEYATREEDLPLPGYSFTSHLTGRHAPGVDVGADLLDGSLHSSLSATFGHGYGLEGDRLRSSRYAARLVAHPLRGVLPEDGGWRERGDGLWAGVTFARDDDFDDPVVVSTPLESTVFRTPRLDGDGGSWLLWEVGYTEGPARVAFSRVDGTAEDVPDGRGGEDDVDQLTSWTVQASWNLTGGRAIAESGAWRTERAEDPGPWGDWELAARYSNADLDRKLFGYGIVTPGLATQEVRTGTYSVSWRPNDVVRLTLAFLNTIADEDLATFGGTRRDRSVVLRLEVVF